MFFSRKRVFQLVLTAIFTILIGFCVAQFVFVKESKARKYYNARASRRGDIRKAKEEKKTISLHQERFGVTRHLWIDDPLYNTQKEFYMEADRAEIVTDIGPKGVQSFEIFQTPKGSIQEELYWEIIGTGEKVEPVFEDEREISHWVYTAPGKKVVDVSLYADIEPKQRVRYFDAARAEWDLVKNEMTAYVVSFCIIEISGHKMPKTVDPAYIVLEGVAENMTFFFMSRDTKKAVVSSGLQLKMGPRSSILDEE